MDKTGARITSAGIGAAVVWVWNAVLGGSLGLWLTTLWSAYHWPEIEPAVAAFFGVMLVPPIEHWLRDDGPDQTVITREEAARMVETHPGDRADIAAAIRTGRE